MRNHTSKVRGAASPDSSKNMLSIAHHLWGLGTGDWGLTKQFNKVLCLGRIVISRTRSKRHSYGSTSLISRDSASLTNRSNPTATTLKLLRRSTSPNFRFSFSR
uniref:Uncharacterized protein n=1 Tax=Candidatus Kentrum sp. SD TaxID=2126332 RepID=A0A451BNC1_9GAMM|nr:MAG: hypothetical protein BECKSD772D_GA0070982_10674 [Candidatus Kentron sp. SD]